MSCYFGQASEVVCELVFWTSQRSGLGVIILDMPAEWFVSCYFGQASGVVCELLFWTSQRSGL